MIRRFANGGCAIVCFYLMGVCSVRTSAGLFHSLVLARVGRARRSFDNTRRTLVRSFATTEYTIDEPGVDVDVLQKTVTKHWENLDRYLSARPIAAHTEEAFSVLKGQLEGNDRPVILDSGCGTGRSSLYLGKLYPDHIIVGVDRSMARLNKNGVYRQQSTEGEGNVILIRAELADFWRLWLESPIGNVERHFLLYPNPYPKKRRFQNRWYAHPAFPMLLQLGGEEIVVRSNWKAYLDDFAMATSLVHQLDDDSKDLSYDMIQTSELDPSAEPWTNFEAKYFNIGETAYELKLVKMMA